MKAYQYAILRYVSDVFGQEFANIGILLFQPDEKLFTFYLHKKTKRLSEFFRGNFEVGAYRALRNQVEKTICKAQQRVQQRLQGHQGQLDQPQDLSSLLPEIFPHDASSFQWSEVIGGIAPDPQSLMADLIRELLTSHEPPKRQRTDAKAIWNNVQQSLKTHGIEVQHDVAVNAQFYEYTFHGGWQNGCLQVLEPISFDFLHSTEIKEHANTWSGRLMNLQKGPTDFSMTGVVQGPDNPNLQRVFNEAIQMLKQAPGVRGIVAVESFDQEIVPLIRRDLEQSRRANSQP